MPEVYKQRIIKLLKHADYTPVKVTQLAKTLGVEADAYPQFKTAFDALRRAGQVILGAGDLVTLPSIAGQVIGTFRANPKGFGFVIPREPNSHGDLFVPPDATADAMSGDIVLAKVVRKGKRAGQTRLTGEVLDVLERASSQFVGTLTRRPEAWIVQPDGTRFFDPIVVEDVTAKNAKERDKVVVEILSYPTESQFARGVIVEVLGRAGQYDTEIEAVIRSFRLPRQFSDECLEQARHAAAAFTGQPEHNREDITDKVIVTIDPPDAKDFDDAISLETDAKGDWVLGVHIADVSDFIAPGSPLDEEGRVRGNSVYLPGKTIPMLPEILSNGICSLQPDQPRFAKSVYISYDKDGRVVSRRYANSIIRSKARLTYLQTDRVLKGHTKDVAPEVIDLLVRMEALARRIEKRRAENGMLHLDLPEPELVFDDSGQVVDAHPADTSYPHTIIEMFMVEANEAVAGLLDRHNVPFMRRIHPEPDALTLQNLSKLLRVMGFPMPRHPDRHALQDLLNAVEGADNSLAINMLVLRSLEKAEYAPSQIGHYALASTHYCHFTSPIRRYADLLVHRQLQLYLEGRIKAAKQIAAGQDLVEIGKHITFTEQSAENAERELVAALILQMLSKHIGDEMDGVVTGLTSFGIFVQSRKFGIEGLIRLEDLGADQWVYNKRAECLMGQRSGCTIQLGHPMKVRILSVNIAARQLNLAPTEALEATPTPRRTRKGRPKLRPETVRKSRKARPKAKAKRKRK
jgi:ribonuclease R